MILLTWHCCFDYCIVLTTFFFTAFKVCHSKTNVNYYSNCYCKLISLNLLQVVNFVSKWNLGKCKSWTCCYHNWRSALKISNIVPPCCQLKMVTSEEGNKLILVVIIYITLHSFVTTLLLMHLELLKVRAVNALQL